MRPAPLFVTFSVVPVVLVSGSAILDRLLLRQQVG